MPKCAYADVKNADRLGDSLFADSIPVILRSYASKQLSKNGGGSRTLYPTRPGTSPDPRSRPNSVATIYGYNLGVNSSNSCAMKGNEEHLDSAGLPRRFPAYRLLSNCVVDSNPIRARPSNVLQRVQILKFLVIYTARYLRVVSNVINIYKYAGPTGSG
jgi:hypothetical protein